MDTKANLEVKSKEDKPKEKQIKRVKKAGKKPTSGPVETRGRAKSTIVSLYDVKKATSDQNEKKQIETIGADRFKNLLSIFNKKETVNQESKEDPGPKKLDMSKFAAFNQNNSSENKNKVNTEDKPIITGSIQQRMQALLNSNKPTTENKPYIDPVLEQRRKMLQEDDDDVEEEEEFDDEFSDSNISEEEDKEEDKEDSEKSLSDDEEETKEEVSKNESSSYIIENSTNDVKVTSSEDKLKEENIGSPVIEKIEISEHIEESKIHSADRSEEIEKST